jgi:hypothetical protein
MFGGHASYGKHGAEIDVEDLSQPISLMHKATPKGVAFDFGVLERHGSVRTYHLVDSIARIKVMPMMRTYPDGMMNYGTSTSSTTPMMQSGGTVTK